MAKRLIVPLFGAILGLAGASAAFGQEAGGSEKLGRVRFETSCNAEAQARFERGVALLHSFWFGQAKAAFASVAEADPSCAMAHWGSAMTALGNPLAAPPSPAALADGAAAVSRA
ncbi:MAG: hypothetical protein ACREGL_00535, partial [Alphaproteobacteria bacterium]